MQSHFPESSKHSVRWHVFAEGTRVSFARREKENCDDRDAGV
jgi:hypothetical protein